MKYSPYRDYKASGIEWFDSIPKNWEVKRLKTSAKCWVSNVNKVPSEEELSVKLVNYTDVYYNESIRPDLALMETTATKEEIKRFGLQVNDILITKDSEEWSDIAVPALVVDTAPDLVCGYHLAIIRPDPKRLLGPFLLRAFQSCAINQQFQVAASGVTRYGLPKSAIGEAWVPIPSLEEQRAIADFLNLHTANIDSLVGKKQNFDSIATKVQDAVKLLQEYRTALITAAVTGKIDVRNTGKNAASGASE